MRLTSGLAFRLDPEGFLLRTSPAPPADANLPPEGCPGNPFVTASVYLPFQYNAALREKRQGIPVNFPPVELLALFGHDGPTRLQDSTIESHGRFKRQFNNCYISGEGVEFCRTCAADDRYDDRCAPVPARPDEIIYYSDFAALGVALPGAYAERKGRRFAVECAWAAFGLRPELTPRQCEVHYELMDGLSVMYRFDSKQIPQDEVLELDRKIRGQILQARAPEHDLPPGRPQ